MSWQTIPHSDHSLCEKRLLKTPLPGSLACLRDIQSWMDNHHLKLNPGKTALIFIPALTSHFSDISISLGETTVTSSPSATNLGVVMDNRLSLSENITAVPQTCRFFLYNIHPSNGPVPPGLLQLTASWPPGICHQTPTTDPERHGTPGIQHSQIHAHHPPAHWPPMAACYSLHQNQDIGACIPGSQGISPSLHPTAHQTLHTCQTSTLRYLQTSGALPPVIPAHLVHDCLFWPHNGEITFL